MPISLEEFLALREERKKPSTVNWDEVISKIIESGQYWSVDEVHKQLVHMAVSRYRVMSVLNDYYRKGKLSRGFDGKRFWFGKKVWKKEVRR